MHSLLLYCSTHRNSNRVSDLISYRISHCAMQAGGISFRVEAESAMGEVDIAICMQSTARVHSIYPGYLTSSLSLTSFHYAASFLSSPRMPMAISHIFPLSARMHSAAIICSMGLSADSNQQEIVVRQASMIDGTALLLYTDIYPYTLCHSVYSHFPLSRTARINAYALTLKPSGGIESELYG